MYLYFFRKSKWNIIVSAIMILIAGFFAILYLTADELYGQFALFFLIIATFYFIAFIISLNREKKEQLLNKEFEEENDISENVFTDPFNAEVIEYIYTNAWNLPGFMVNIKSGYIEIGQKVLLPDGKKRQITNIFFPPKRFPTRRAYAGETVKIIISGVRDNSILDVGMNVSK